MAEEIVESPLERAARLAAEAAAARAAAAPPAEPPTPEPEATTPPDDPADATEVAEGADELTGALERMRQGEQEQAAGRTNPPAVVDGSGTNGTTNSDGSGTRRTSRRESGGESADSDAVVRLLRTRLTLSSDRARTPRAILDTAKQLEPKETGVLLLLFAEQVEGSDPDLARLAVRAFELTVPSGQCLDASTQCLDAGTMEYLLQRTRGRVRSTSSDRTTKLFTQLNGVHRIKLLGFPDGTALREAFTEALRLRIEEGTDSGRRERALYEVLSHVGEPVELQGFWVRFVNWLRNLGWGAILFRVLLLIAVGAGLAALWPYRSRVHGDWRVVVEPLVVVVLIAAVVWLFRRRTGVMVTLTFVVITVLGLMHYNQAWDVVGAAQRGGRWLLNESHFAKAVGLVPPAATAAEPMVDAGTGATPSTPQPTFLEPGTGVPAPAPPSPATPPRVTDGAAPSAPARAPAPAVTTTAPALPPFVANSFSRRALENLRGLSGEEQYRGFLGHLVATETRRTLEAQPGENEPTAEINAWVKVREVIGGYGSPESRRMLSTVLQLSTTAPLSFSGLGPLIAPTTPVEELHRDYDN